MNTECNEIESNPAKLLAARLDGRSYGDEITIAEGKEAASQRLVVVFGSSDDLLEFRGAIDEEVSAWEGATVAIDQEGIQDLDECRNECECKNCSRIRAIFKKSASNIRAIWCESSPGIPWTIESEAPSFPFVILEDGEPFCRGAVLSLDDLKPRFPITA